MEHPLDGAWKKLKWAKINLQSLEDEVAAFFGDEANPESLRGSLQVQSGTAFPKPGQAPPWHWSLLVGDIVQAFRASLDYLAWELARHNLARLGKTRKPSRPTAFPLVIKPGDWSKVSSPKLADIGEAERARIKEFQPYQTEGEDRPVLSWLRTLSNRDKHQALNLVLIQHGALAEGLEDELSGWAMTYSPHREHATIETPGGDKKSDIYLKAMFQIEVEGVDRIDWILDGIGPKVAEILGAFEPVFEDA